MAEYNADGAPENGRGSSAPANGSGGNVLAGGAPPHNEEAETSVLGAILLAPRWLDTVTVEAHLQPHDFYRPRHRTIYQSMLDISSANEPIDTLTVSARLKETGLLEEAGGNDYIETLVARIPAIANTRQYAQIVKENSLMRGLIRATQEIQESVANNEGDPQELLERAQQRVFEVAQDAQSGELVQLSEILHDELERIEHQWKHGDAMTGTPTGFKDIDELTGGLQPGNLIIIAARPSMGKSALVTNIAENAALAGKPVALFSLEMSKTELSQRFLASQAKESGDAMRKGTLKKASWPKVLEAAQRLSTAPLWIDDSSDISIVELRAKARRLHGKFLGGESEGLGLIIVDYLQLLRANDGRDSRVEQVAQMSRGLKILARELEVPVIAVSQLSRAVESRTPPKPQLSDLRECVTGDTLVQLADGRRLPIIDLVGEAPDVFALGDDNKIDSYRSDKVWAVGEKEVFDLRLKSGRSIRATAKHRMLTGAGWREVRELGIGDRVALANGLPEPTNFVDWSSDKIALLGQMIGDGSYLSGQPMRFTSASDANSEIVSRAAESEFGCNVTRYDHRPNWHQLLISGNGSRWHARGVNAWFRDLGIFSQRSNEKRIPTDAFRLSNEGIATLLQHLWATDGSIWVGRRKDGRAQSRVAYSTTSPGLARDVASLLLRLGIVARINAVTDALNNSIEHVIVSGAANQARFIDVVGAFGPRIAGARQLVEHLESLSAANTNVDTLPLETWSIVRTRMAEQKISQRKMAAARGTSYGGTSHFKFAPSRETVSSYAELLDSSELRSVVSAEQFWDEVVEVVPDGVETVYDLTVPGPANWIANEGIITHNSGQIEQDADVVAFIYREEYYLREESERPGIADVIFAKHRNGPVGEIELTFLSRYPKFTNKPKGYDGGGGSSVPDRVPAGTVGDDDWDDSYGSGGGEVPDL